MSRRSKKKFQRAASPLQGWPGNGMPGGATKYIPAGQLQSLYAQTFYGNKLNVPSQDATMFSPGVPLYPQPGVNKAGLPVQYQFPIAFNTFPVDRTSGNPDLPSFQQLRMLAKSYSGIALCERAWLDMVPRMELKIDLRPDLVAQGAEPKDYQKEMSYFLNWFQKPDGRRDIHTWLRMALREQTQIDELYIYKNKTRGGKLLGLHVVAGDTMKPLLNDWGDIPIPSDPDPYAYQQYPWGIPGMQYTMDHMIHYQESPAADNPYGQSRVERIIMEVNQALRKKRRDLAMFTEGNVPSGIMEVPDGSNWTPDQIDAYEQLWNSLIAGNPQQQARVKFTQPGMKYIKTDSGEILTDFDLFLLNIATGAYGMSMQDLSFTGDIHKSNSDSQQNVLYRRTIGPLALVYGGILTDCMQHDFDPSLHGDMFVLSFGGFEESEDIGALATAYSTLTNAGILGLSNAGKLLKLPEDPDAPHIGRVFMSKDGPIFLDDMASDKVRNAALQAKLAGLQLATQQPQQNQGEKNAEDSQDDTEKDDQKQAPPDQKADQNSDQATRRTSDDNASTSNANADSSSKKDDQKNSQERSAGLVPDAIERSCASTAGLASNTQAESEQLDGQIQETESNQKASQAGELAKDTGDRSATTSVGKSDQTDDSQEQQHADYRRWRDVALKDIKAGKHVRRFTSDVIPEDIHNQLSQALERCATGDEVRAIFKAAQEGDTSFFA